MRISPTVRPVLLAKHRPHCRIRGGLVKMVVLLEVVLFHHLSCLALVQLCLLIHYLKD